MPAQVRHDGTRIFPLRKRLGLRGDLGDERGGVDSEQPCDLDEFGDFEAARAPLVIGDERLGPVEPFGEIGLPKTARPARLVETPAQPVGRALADRGGRRRRLGRTAVESDELPRQPLELHA